MTKVNSQHTVYCRLAKYFFTNGKYSIEDIQNLVLSNYIDENDYEDITGKPYPSDDKPIDDSTKEEDTKKTTKSSKK